MFNFKLLCALIFLFSLHETKSEISDKRLCANEDCTEPISQAKTLLMYPSAHRGMLSFAKNVDATVYSKSAGSNMELWGVEINGRRGYARREHLREGKIYTSKLLHVVDTEPIHQQVPSANSKPQEIVASNVQEHDVIAGTTIYRGYSEDVITPTITAVPVLATASTQDTYENNTLDENNEVEHVETEPLDISMTDKPINNAEKSSGNEDIDSQLDLGVTIGDNELKIDSKVLEDSNDKTDINEDDSKEVEDSNLKLDNKESIAENILHTITNWMGDQTNNEVQSESIIKDSDDSTKVKDDTNEKLRDAETVENSIVEENKLKDDVEDSDDWIEENEEDDDYDDAEDENDLEDDELSEEADIRKEINENYERTNQLLQTSDVNHNTSELADKELLNSVQLDETIDEISTENVNSQQNSDKDTEIKISINSEAAFIEETRQVDPSTANGVEASNKEDAEAVTESDYIKVPGFEVPVPHDYDFVTPNPVQHSASLTSNISSQVELESKSNEIINDSQYDPNTKADDNKLEEDNKIVEQISNEEIVEVGNKEISENEDVKDIESLQQENNIDKSIHEHKNEILENIESIENHDYSFSSMINKEQNYVSPNEYQPNYPMEDSAVVQGTDLDTLPTEETISNEVEKQEIITQSSENPSHNFNEIVELPTASNEVLEVIQKPEDMQEYENAHVFDVHDQLLSKNAVDYGSCPAGEGDCPDEITVIQKQLEMDEISSMANFFDLFNLLSLLGATGLSVVLFLLGYLAIDKSRREGPLIAKINTLEKALLVASKENTFLSETVTEVQNKTTSENDRISDEKFEDLNRTYQEVLVTKSTLEEQIQSLEKELENSTEVGLELNRMLQDILSSQNGSEILIANVEQLQRQLLEQQSTINTVNDTLNLKDTENHELQLELEIKNKKVTQLQAELDKMAMNLLKVEEDKEQMQAKLEGEIIELKDQFEQSKNTFNSTRTRLLDETNTLKSKYAEVQRNLDVKVNEYTILKDNFNQIKTIKNNTEALESLLNASSIKAELQQLQRDNQALNDLFRQEQQTKFTLEKQVEIALQEAQSYRAKYDEADKDKLEARTKLEVLSSYFKDREAQLQKELTKQESMWVEQRGEATSTVERIKYMQEELQNCKAQNDLLKQEIVTQEAELKSQISVLEKKAHESWLSARQAERRLEDAKQEAAQLRNRLTLKERSFIEDKSQNRIQSPLEQNGDVALSPLHMPVDSPASPPLLYGTRDHLTTSPPISSMPPFLPPPPGVPFMPPPLPGVPGFMPPPPPMFPVDHRPPPLGRMSSPPPPLNSRYSPDSRYSPYDRNSPSPPYDDEYGSSPPPMHRRYSPYNNRDDRRDFKRPPPPIRTNGRNKGAISSGSGNSNESLEKINRHHSKV